MYALLAIPADISKDNTKTHPSGPSETICSKGSSGRKKLQEGNGSQDRVNPKDMANHAQARVSGFLQGDGKSEAWYWVYAASPGIHGKEGWVCSPLETTFNLREPDKRRNYL